MLAYSSHHHRRIVASAAIIGAIMLSFGQHGSLAFPLPRESREIRVRCDLHSLPGYAGWDFTGRVPKTVCGGWCPADDLVFEPHSSSSPSSCVPTATRTIFKFLRKQATHQAAYPGGKNRRQQSNPWSLGPGGGGAFDSQSNPGGDFDSDGSNAGPELTQSNPWSLGPGGGGGGGFDSDGPEPDHAPAGIANSILQHNPWGLPNPKPAVDPTPKPAGTLPANAEVAPKPAPQQPAQSSDGFDAEEHCNRAADRCMAFDDDAEACDAFKPCINLWMLAGRLKLLKVPTACGCGGTPDAEDEETDCDDEWICEKTDFTTCRCFEPEGTEDANAGCAAQSDRTGDAVCGWNADTEQCTGCPMLEEGDCRSSANPNCEWKVTVCGVVDAASHTAPPFDSAGNICV